ncbi:MAG: glycosyltransferase [Cyclobacteriaceae bacterium]
MSRAKQILIYVFIAGLSVLLCIKGVRPAWTGINSDFANYYVSAKILLTKEPLEKIYDNDWFQSKIKEYGIDTPGKFAPFPPITAFVMLPIASLEPLPAQRVFMIINLIFIVIGTSVVRKISNWSWSVSLLALLVGGLSLINNVAFGQLYLIMTVALLYVYVLINQHRPILASTILALFISIKYFPIILVVALFLLGFLENEKLKRITYLKTSSFSIVLLGLLCGFQFYFFGTEVMTEFFKSSLIPHIGGDLQGQNPYSFQFQSWESLFRNLFVLDPEFNPHPWINIPMLKNVFLALIIISIGTFTSIILFQFRSHEKKEAVYFSLPALAAMVVFPASASYHFILLLVPIIILMSSFIFDKSYSFIAISIYVAIGFIPYSWFFHLGENGTAAAYPRLYLLVILYFVVIKGLMNGLKEKQKSRIAMIGFGHIGGGILGQGVPVIYTMVKKMSNHFDINFYSLMHVELKSPPAGLKIYSISNSRLLYRVKYVFLLMKIIGHHFNRPFDILYAVSTFPAGRLAVFLKSILQKPVVVHLIADEMVSMPDINYGELLKPKLKEINARVCAEANELIVLTEFQRKIVSQNLRISREIRVMPLRIEIDKFPYQEKELRTPVNFIHIGYYHRVKDQITLFQSFALIAKKMDCTLTIVGDGFQVKEVTDLLNQLQINDKVLFTGTKMNDELYSLFKDKHILLHTSYYEAECAVVMEAMASGVVVCGTAVGFLSDHGKGLAEVVPPGDPKILSEIVLKLIDDPIRYKLLRTNARKYIAEYSSEWSNKNYLNFFNSLVESDR